MNQVNNIEAAIDTFRANFNAIQSEINNVIVGNEELVKFTLAAMFAGGHVLLEGAPGLGKTLLVKSVAEAMNLSFNRIQFTSDLMPSDITGTQVLSENSQGVRSFEFKEGPIFANIILADEVNRAGPKTQSALLEAMEEKQVTILGETHILPQPFFVLATQNPIELEGTYPLPEAQLDRFIFKLLVPSPSPSSLKEILSRTTGSTKYQISPVFSEQETVRTVLAMRQLVREVQIAPPLEDILVGLVFGLTPDSNTATSLTSKLVRFGPGPRGAQAVLLTAKVFALLDGRVNVSFEDIKLATKPALRHRIILNYQAEAEGVDVDEIIDELQS